MDYVHCWDSPYYNFTKKQKGNTTPALRVCFLLSIFSGFTLWTCYNIIILLMVLSLFLLLTIISCVSFFIVLIRETALLPLQTSHSLYQLNTNTDLIMFTSLQQFIQSCGIKVVLQPIFVIEMISTGALCISSCSGALQ